MKNRTLLGLICILVSLVLFFVVFPLFSNKESNETSEIYRAKTAISRGEQVTAEMIEKVKVAKSSLTGKELTDEKQIVGKYAASEIYAGDALFASKFNDTTSGTDEALYRLKDGEYAVTVSVSDFARGFSGQLKNGDIVRLYYTDSEGTKVPEELTYVRVITTVNNNGKNLDTLDDEKTTSNVPSSIMFAVNDIQASILFGEGRFSCAFVCHGDDARAEGFLKTQQAFFDAQANQANAPEVGQ